MEMEFEQFYARATAARPAGTLDWHGLAVRLAATHAGRQVPAGNRRWGQSPAGSVATGSFAPRLASTIAAYAQAGIATAAGPAGGGGDAAHQRSHPVNPKAKADSKPPCRIEGDVAGVNETGLRGLL